MKLLSSFSRCLIWLNCNRSKNPIFQSRKSSSVTKLFSEFSFAQLNSQVCLSRRRRRQRFASSPVLMGALQLQDCARRWTKRTKFFRAKTTTTATTATLYTRIRIVLRHWHCSSEREHRSAKPIDSSNGAPPPIIVALLKIEWNRKKTGKKWTPLCSAPVTYSSRSLFECSIQPSCCM